MAARQLSFGDEARDKIRRGVDTLAQAVKVTRQALQNVGSIAELILTADCLIANASLIDAAAHGLPGGAAPEF